MTPGSPGWLPTAIGLDAKSGKTVVKWLQLGSRKLTEPFFDQTVEKFRQAQSPANEISTSLEALIQVADRLPDVTPAGFIFHVSRCGSTLIANALKAGDCTVVSEAAPLSILLHPDAESFVPPETSWEDQRRTLLRLAVRLFATYRTGSVESVVIKFPSWNILFWSVVRSCWPDVPCVVVIRDPIEVIVANLEGGGWMEFKKSSELAARMFGWDRLPRPVEKMSDTEFAARAIGSFYTCAGTMRAESTRVIHYDEINLAQIRLIAGFFGLRLPAEDAPIQHVLGRYSKDPRELPFEPDSRRKQGLATALARSAAQQWATTAYKALRRGT